MRRAGWWSSQKIPIGLTENHDGARRLAGDHRVNDDAGVAALPGLEERQAVSPDQLDAYARQIRALDLLSHQQPHSIVAAVRMAAAHHHDHDRCSSSFRKCVAQDMQGS